MTDKHTRSIVKGISWRILATLTTVILVYIFTREFYIAGAVGFLEVLTKIGLYYTHERVWNVIKWGTVK